MRDGEMGNMMDTPPQRDPQREPQREPMPLGARFLRLALLGYILGVIVAMVAFLVTWAAHAQTAPVYAYEFTGIAVEETGAGAVVATMPPHQVLYSNLTDCASDGYLSAWVNGFPFLAAGMKGAVAYACTPIQPTFGASNATMIITLVGPNRPIWQVGLSFATQTLCTQNISSLAALQSFIGNFNWLSSLVPVPTALASTTMTTQAQYQATDVAGGTDNVTVACPPGGPS